VIRAIAVAVVLLEVVGRPAAAQDAVIDHMQLDRLQLVSLGAGSGTISPSQVNPTTIYMIGSDYGEISPAWRVIFRVSYWQSQFKPSVVQEFVDSLQKNLVDPTATTVRMSPVTVYDATFGIGARRLLSPRSAITPFFSGGFAAHVINAEGPLIKGTFVERALDDVGGGVFGEVGLRISLFRRVLVEGAVRGDLLSGFRSTQWYAMGSYFFGEPRRGGSGR
jgi:hypothetical protein